MPAGYPASGGAGLQMPAGYPASNSAAVAGANTSTSSQGTYTVKKGDTLFNIAQKVYGKGNGKLWRKILSANPNCLRIPGNTKTLKIGAVLTIPSV
jgi:nucleoid-associated protein YgaU